MIDYILLAIEISLLLGYPLTKTYQIWKKVPLTELEYRETVTYWIIFAGLQSLCWAFDKTIYSLIRIPLIFLLAFKLPFVSSLVFKVKDKKVKTN
jgi:hypothetical protein